MEFHREGNTDLYLFDGLHPDGTPAVFAIKKEQIAAFRHRESYVPIVHLMNIVSPGLVMAEHIFKGLKRPLQYEGNAKADAEKLIFSWSAKYDYDWEYNMRFDASGMTRRPAPHGRVYVVIASPNLNKEVFTSIDYWINKWSWVHADPGTPGAPVQWPRRYDSKIR
jgi:hypothetical protein